MLERPNQDLFVSGALLRRRSSGSGRPTITALPRALGGYRILVECVVEEAIEATVQADERVQIRQAELLDYEEENFG
jgi:hypothetical protein